MLLPCWYCGIMIDSKFLYCNKCRKNKKDKGMAVKRIKYITINKERQWFESKHTFDNGNITDIKIWLYVDSGYGIAGRVIGDKVIAERTFYAKTKDKLLIAAKKTLVDWGVDFGEENRDKRIGLHQYAVKSLKVEI